MPVFANTCEGHNARMINMAHKRPKRMQSGCLTRNIQFSNPFSDTSLSAMHAIFPRPRLPLSRQRRRGATRLTVIRLSYVCTTAVRHLHDCQFLAFLPVKVHFTGQDQKPCVQRSRIIVAHAIRTCIALAHQSRPQTRQWSCCVFEINWQANAVHHNG